MLAAGMDMGHRRPARLETDHEASLARRLIDTDRQPRHGFGRYAVAAIGLVGGVSRVDDYAVGATFTHGASFLLFEML